VAKKQAKQEHVLETGTVVIPMITRIIKVRKIRKKGKDNYLVNS